MGPFFFPQNSPPPSNFQRPAGAHREKIMSQPKRHCVDSCVQELLRSARTGTLHEHQWKTPEDGERHGTILLTWSRTKEVRGFWKAPMATKEGTLEVPYLPRLSRETELFPLRLSPTAGAKRAKSMVRRIRKESRVPARFLGRPLLSLFAIDFLRAATRLKLFALRGSDKYGPPLSGYLLGDYASKPV